MARIRIIESSEDPLRRTIGKSKEVIVNQDGTERLGNPETVKMTATLLERRTEVGQISLREISTIRLDMVDKDQSFEELITNSIRTGVEYTDHYVTLPNLEDASNDIKTDSRSYITMYECDSVFNYAANIYDEQVKVVSELSIPPLFVKPEMSNFLDISLNNSPFSLFETPSKNLVLPEFPEIDSKEYLNKFPYYNKLKMVNPVNGEFFNFTKEIRAFDEILGAYLISEKPVIPFNVERDNVVFEDFEIPVFDLSSWATSPNLFLLDNYYPLDEESLSDSKMIKDYKKLLIAGYIRNISVSKFRTFEQILMGVEGHKQDFVYSMDKWRTARAGDPLQTVFIPSTKNETIFNDTQIKYGETYIYNCSSHFLIVGNKYRYENLSIVTEEDVPYAIVEVHNEPSVVLVPVSMFEKTLTTFQKPPLSPQVKFITENNSSRRIDIYLSATGGEIEQQFEPIFPEDQEQENSISLIHPDLNVMFRDYDESALYQVFKSTKKPDTYLDFDKIDEIRMPFVDSSAIFRDMQVVPNRKSYYMFRKVNQKGLVSNPTSIYEVELVIDADDSKVVVNTYEFPEPVTSQDTRKFKQLFQIAPSVEQTLFDDEDPALENLGSLKGKIDDLKIGLVEKAIWGRTMKFRFKSTKTGRIIDYNVTFTLTKNKSEEEF
jgi:hypothetical protein